MILLGLVAIGLSSAFFGNAVAVSVYAMAGLMWIGLTDSARRAAVSRAHSRTSHPVTAGSRPMVEVVCVARQACPAA